MAETISGGGMEDSSTSSSSPSGGIENGKLGSRSQIRVILSGQNTQRRNNNNNNNNSNNNSNDNDNRMSWLFDAKILVKKKFFFHTLCLILFHWYGRISDTILIIMQNIYRL